MFSEIGSARTTPRKYKHTRSSPQSEQPTNRSHAVQNSAVHDMVATSVSSHLGEEKAHKLVVVSGRRPLNHDALYAIAHGGRGQGRAQGKFKNNQNRAKPLFLANLKMLVLFRADEGIKHFQPDLSRCCCQMCRIPSSF